ncbi:MAG: hypothetical protein ACI8PD_002127 [Nitrospinales bacterium]|jgi:hypothetical protein
MIEQYLQVALEFVKEIWFQLDSQFGLEGTEAFKFIHPYLLQLEDNPTYMGIAFAALVLVPFGLYKVRSISRERERKLDDLMEEMEEDELDELDEDDPSRLRRPAPDDEETTSEVDDEDDEEDDKPLFEMEDEEPPPYMQILEKLDEEESEDELDLDTQKVMGEDKVLEPVSSELAESQIDKELSEFEEFEFDSDPVKNDSPHDQAIQELQEDGQLTELEGELSPDDPFANYSELDDDEQDRAIQELQDEMESTINKLTEQLESTPETTSAIKDLGDIRIGDGATIDEEYIFDEELSLEEPPEKNDPSPEPLSLEALVLEDEVEPAIENIEPVIEDIESIVTPLQPVPERDYAIEEKPDRQVDSLINRLKYFQENLDTRFHHDEKRESTPAPKTVDIVEEHHFVEQQSFATKKAPVDNKKYMEVLESFIFLKDQNKHK